MSANELTDPRSSGFKRASELARRPPIAAAAVDDQDVPAEPVEVELVSPQIPIERAIEIWNANDRFRRAIIAAEGCADDIGGKLELNRTGLSRLALAYGLSIAQMEVIDQDVTEADTNEHDHRYVVVVRVSRGARHVDGIGSCRLSEIEEKTKTGQVVSISQREHFALTRAYTRASKRATADMLGGNEAD